jgi:hypothetical protein
MRQQRQGLTKQQRQLEQLVRLRSAINWACDADCWWVGYRERLTVAQALEVLR